MNTGQFAGRLGGDGDLRVTPSGTPVLNFSLAVDAGFGENKKTLWIDCAVWGDRGEKLHPYMTKGKSVTVLGDIDLRTFEDRSGKTRAVMTCNVQRLTLQGDAAGKSDGNTKPAAAAKPATTGAQYANATQGGDFEFDDDIPF